MTLDDETREMLERSDAWTVVAWELAARAPVENAKREAARVAPPIVRKVQTARAAARYEVKRKPRTSTAKPLTQSERDERRRARNAKRAAQQQSARAT